MKIFGYRQETDPELIKAATAAYREAPPNRNGGRSAFARQQNRSVAPALAGPAQHTVRADRA